MEKPKRESKGSLALLALMPKHGDQGELALRLNLNQDQISRWSTGDRKPDPKSRALLEDKLGISWRSWDEAPEPKPSEKQGAA